MKDLIKLIDDSNKTQLAEKSGVSLRHIHFITSRTKKPSLDVIKKLCKALEINISDIDFNKI